MYIIRLWVKYCTKNTCICDDNGLLRSLADTHHFVRQIGSLYINDMLLKIRM